MKRETYTQQSPFDEKMCLDICPQTLSMSRIFFFLDIVTEICFCFPVNAGDQSTPKRVNHTSDLIKMLLAKILARWFSYCIHMVV